MNKKDKYFYELNVPSFIERIELSKKRRAQYYKTKNRIPKRYLTDEYDFGKEGVLVSLDTGIKVIKNSRSVGTPNVKMITGQYFWTGAHPHIRRKIKREMSDFFYKFMKDIPPVQKHQYPIGIRIDLYDEMMIGQDLDNFIFLYRKVIHDVLTAKEMEHDAFIIDDSKEYIQDIPTTFYPIDNHEDRFLNIQIYSI
jgi:hypothetical protein